MITTVEGRKVVLIEERNEKKDIKRMSMMEKEKFR